jgi:hypothetical protein
MKKRPGKLPWSRDETGCFHVQRWTVPIRSRIAVKEAACPFHKSMVTYCMVQLRLCLRLVVAVTLGSIPKQISRIRLMAICCQGILSIVKRSWIHDKTDMFLQGRVRSFEVYFFEYSTLSIAYVCCLQSYFIYTIASAFSR